MQDIQLKSFLRKCKVMAFTGNFPTRSKIVDVDTILEQVSQYNFLRGNISFNEDMDTERK